MSLQVWEAEGGQSWQQGERRAVCARYLPGERSSSPNFFQSWLFFKQLLLESPCHCLVFLQAFFFGGIDPVASSQPLEVTYFLLAFGWRTRWPHRRSSPIGRCAPRNPFILLPTSSLRLCLSETWLTPLVISVIAGFPAISRLYLHQLILYKSRF